MKTYDQITHKSSFAEAIAQFKELLVDPQSNFVEMIHPLVLVAKGSNTESMGVCSCDNESYTRVCFIKATV